MIAGLLWSCGRVLLGVQLRDAESVCMCRNNILKGVGGGMIEKAGLVEMYQIHQKCICQDEIWNVVLRGQRVPLTTSQSIRDCPTFASTEEVMVTAGFYLHV